MVGATGTLLTFLPEARSGTAAIRKPAKIDVATPTLSAAIAGVKGMQLQHGTPREAFLASQVASEHPITAHASATIEIGCAPPLVIEIGGPGKRAGRLPSDTRDILALDGVDHGHGCTVPLSAFGFRYERRGADRPTSEHRTVSSPTNLLMAANSTTA